MDELGWILLSVLGAIEYRDRMQHKWECCDFVPQWAFNSTGDKCHSNQLIEGVCSRWHWMKEGDKGGKKWRPYANAGSHSSEWIVSSLYSFSLLVLSKNVATYHDWIFTNAATMDYFLDEWILNSVTIPSFEKYISNISCLVYKVVKKS